MTSPQLRTDVDTTHAARLQLWVPDGVQGREMEPPGPGEPTVGELAAAYLADERGELKPVTFADRKRVIDHFVASFGCRLASSFRPSELRAWVNEQADWKKPTTRWCRANTIKRLFNWAVDDLRIPANPFRSVRFEKGDPRRPTSRAEWQFMMRHSDLAFRWVLVFLRFTGARPEVPRELQWEWIDWKRARATIPKGQHKTGRKTRSSLVVLLLPPVLKLLAWMRRRCAGAGSVFFNSRGRRWWASAFGQRLKALHDLGLDAEASLHGLRHLLGTYWLERGGNLKLLSIFLGHSSARTTEQVYVHDDHLGEAVMGEACKVFGFPPGG